MKTLKQFNLTPRQLEICKHLKTGIGRKEIAQRTKSSVKTIDVHLGSIRQKIGVARTAQVKDAIKGFAAR